MISELEAKAQKLISKNLFNQDFACIHVSSIQSYPKKSLEFTKPITLVLYIRDPQSYCLFNPYLEIFIWKRSIRECLESLSENIFVAIEKARTYTNRNNVKYWTNYITF
jgi:hypothetical protein